METLHHKHKPANLPGMSRSANIGPMSQLTSLYLAPASPDSAPDKHAVGQVLSDLDIIADPLGPAIYTAGVGFSRHVIYAGCSPFLVMQPPEDGSRQFCHVVLHGPYVQPQLITGPNTVKPRCPVCRERFNNWREQLTDWQIASQSAHCDACGGNFPPSNLDWRGHAVSGRILIELRNVFPGEASPSDLLMQRLEEQTGEAWQYAWAAYHDAGEPGATRPDIGVP